MLRLVRVVPLPHEHGGQASVPGLLHRRQDPELVVDHDVAPCRIPAFDVVQHLFLVDVDQHLALDRRPQPRPLDLARLKDDVAVGEERGPPAPPERAQRVQRAGIDPAREGIVQEEQRDLQDVHLARTLGAVTLQGAEIIRIAKLVAQLLEDLPVAPIAVRPERLDQMTPQVRDHRVVVEQRVVDVHQEHQVAGHRRSTFDVLRSSLVTVLAGMARWRSRSGRA